MVKAQCLIDFELISLNFLFGPIELSECPETEIAILLIDSCKIIPVLVLFDFFKFDAIFGVIVSILLLELQIKVYKAVALD